MSSIISISEKDYPVKTKWIAADFSEGEKTYKHIEKELSGISVGILGKFIIILQLKSHV